MGDYWHGRMTERAHLLPLLGRADELLRRTECVPMERGGKWVHCMVCHGEGERGEHHQPGCELAQLLSELSTIDDTAGEG